jgi:hypothetical protein
MFAAETLPNLPELTLEQAEHWVAAALAQARALRQHDEQLWPSVDDAEHISRAEQLHAAWRIWADDASVLYQRLAPLMKAKRHVGGAADLNYTIARTRAMLKLSPRDMLTRLDQMRRGEVVSAEEVRRELRMASDR